MPPLSDRSADGGGEAAQDADAEGSAPWWPLTVVRNFLSPRKHAPLHNAITESSGEITSLRNQAPLRNSLAETSRDIVSSRKQAPLHHAVTESSDDIVSSRKQASLHKSATGSSRDIIRFRKQAPLRESFTVSRGDRVTDVGIKIEDGIKAEDVRDEVSREIPLSQPTTVQMSLGGGDVLVKLNGSNISFKIQYDGLEKVRIFGSGTEGFVPMTVQSPGNFNAFLFKHRSSNTFDFFGLPGEIRNNIYALVFKEPVDELRFTWRRVQKYPKFYARLIKDATGRCGLPFVNRQSLSETTAFFLKNRKVVINGDKQLLAFLKSIGPFGRAAITGPLSFRLSRWDKDYTFMARWGIPLADCQNLRKIEMVIHGIIQLQHDDPTFSLMARGKGKFPRLEKIEGNSMWSTADQRLMDDLLSWFKETRGGDNDLHRLIQRINEHVMNFYNIRL